MTIPLDPGIGGKSIGPESLRISDIIVSTTQQFVSKAVRLGTMSKVSHSALYIGGSQVVEALLEGVVVQPLAVSLHHDTLAVVYRYPALKDITALQIRDYVGNQIGKPYSKLGAAASGVARAAGGRRPLGESVQFGFVCAKAAICVTENSNPATTDTFFCSQLLAAAFASASVSLIDMAAKVVTPADIVDVSVNLIYVGHLKP
jgi:uncharacterized protein YycO